MILPISLLLLKIIRVNIIKILPIKISRTFLGHITRVDHLHNIGINVGLTELLVMRPWYFTDIFIR